MVARLILQRSHDCRFYLPKISRQMKLYDARLSGLKSGPRLCAISRSNASRACNRDAQRYEPSLT
jgi:hypothetical protein